METNYATLGFVLLGVGFVFLAGEMFLPSGVLLVLSVGCIAVGVGLTFTAGPMTGLLTLLGVFAAIPTLAVLLFKVWPKTPMGRHFYLTRPREDATVTAMPHIQEMEKLRGRIGKTLAPLRPAGVADFDGRRVDVITEGMMVEGGRWVRCIDVRAGKVIVRPVDKPAVADLEGDIFT
jgi:membrane-bound serine protease (ClpP class)